MVRDVPIGSATWVPVCAVGEHSNSLYIWNVDRSCDHDPSRWSDREQLNILIASLDYRGQSRTPGPLSDLSCKCLRWVEAAKKRNSLRNIVRAFLASACMYC